jgi:hypothetical protein
MFCVAAANPPVDWAFFTPETFMTHVSRLVMLLVVCLLLVSTASADTLLANFAYTGTADLPASGGSPEFQPFLAYGPPTLPAPGLINNVTMSVLDIAQGNTYELSGDFATFAELASNGSDESLYVGFTVPNDGGSWTSTTESANLAAAFFTALGVGNPDYFGYDLTRVVVIGTSFSIAPDDQFELTVEYSVYGNRTVPEPGTLAMLATGAGALLLCRRRRRHR